MITPDFIFHDNLEPAEAYKKAQLEKILEQSAPLETEGSVPKEKDIIPLSIPDMLEGFSSESYPDHDLVS